MRVHSFHHVPFEGLSVISEWVASKKFSLESTLLDDSAVFPELESFDLLFVMGGPMGTRDEVEYPWLKREKEFIAQSIKANKKVVGVCLGAQLIANALGASVFSNAYKEIGWHEVVLTNEGLNHKFLKKFPKSFTCLHWHGDTFEIPQGAEHLAKSKACANQIYTYGDNVLALQCHLEWDKNSLGHLIKHCSGELIPSEFVQTSEEMNQADKDIHYQKNRILLFQLLDNFLESDS